MDYQNVIIPYADTIKTLTGTGSTDLRAVTLFSHCTVIRYFRCLPVHRIWTRRHGEPLDAAVAGRNTRDDARLYLHDHARRDVADGAGPGGGPAASPRA